MCAELCWGKGSRKKKLIWPKWMHGCLRGRRREDSELVHRTNGERLRAAGVAHISGLEDMSDAFACTASAKRLRVNDVLVREKDISLVNVRATNSSVRITTSEE